MHRGGEDVIQIWVKSIIISSYFKNYFYLHRPSKNNHGIRENN